MTPTSPPSTKGVTEALANLAHEMRFLLRQNPEKDGGLYRQRLDEAESALASLSLPPPGEGAEPKSLDERMEAAGMIPLSRLLSGDTPLAKWEAHTGVRTLAHFEEWLLRRHREIKTMHAEYALGDKDESDELYEWVLAHSGAFSEVVANWRQVSAMSILSTPAAPELAVKDGWVMVPKEPTPHMMAKAFDAVELGNVPGFATGNQARRAIWDAMLAASPQQGEKA